MADCSVIQTTEMIEFIDAKNRLIKGVDLSFPNNLLCSSIFNELFVNGKSFKEFEQHFRTKAVKVERLNNPEWSSFHKYVLKKNMLGSVIELIIGTGGKNADALATLACRDDKEFMMVSRFFESNPRIRFIGHHSGTNQYAYQITKTTYSDMRSITIVTTQENVQVCTLTLLLEL